MPPQLILSTNDFLVYLSENKQFQPMKYDSFELANPELFSKIIDLSEQHSIDIYPYLYVIQTINQDVLKAFVRFYFIFLKKSDFEIELNNNTDLLNIVSKSLEHLLAFIYTIQYFFL